MIAAIEGRAHVHSEYALLASVIVAAEGATFHDIPHFAGGIVPGDGIFTAWRYRAGAGRAEAFLLNPQPLTARTAYEWGVVAEVVPNGKALSRARELAELYLKEFSSQPSGTRMVQTRTLENEGCGTQRHPETNGIPRVKPTRGAPTKKRRREVDEGAPTEAGAMLIAGRIRQSAQRDENGPNAHP